MKAGCEWVVVNGVVKESCEMGLCRKGVVQGGYEGVL